MKNILIIGATSAIAQAFARLQTSGNQFFLVARNSERLQIIADDLQARGSHSVTTRVMDINQLDAHSSVIEAAQNTLGNIDVALLAHGTLPDQTRCESDADYLLQEFNTNAGATLHFLQQLGGVMQTQNSGTIAVITSVAGDRGRQSNYLYGSAKAAVQAFTSGLRNKLYPSGVQVVDIRPGFVDTPMTAEFSKGALWATPETVAKGIVRAVEKGQNIAYLPFFWRYIMLIIKLIPEPVFKRLKL